MKRLAAVPDDEGLVSWLRGCKRALLLGGSLLALPGCGLPSFNTLVPTASPLVSAPTTPTMVIAVLPTATATATPPLPTQTLVPPTIGPTPTPRPPLLRWLDAPADRAVKANIDPTNNLPVVRLRIEADTQRGFPQLLLDADALEVAEITWVHDQLGHTVRERVAWPPWHGNGLYHLDMRMARGDGKVLAHVPLTVTVTGIPPETPVLQERFAVIYREALGVNLTAPVFSYFPDCRGRRTQHRGACWISTAYAHNRLYTVDLFLDGMVDAVSDHLYPPGKSGERGYCFPQGTYRVLVVVVDFGNVPGVRADDVEARLRKAAEVANHHWAEVSAHGGAPGPLLLVVPTFVHLDGASLPEGELFTDAVTSLTGEDLGWADADGDGTVEVLDSAPYGWEQ